MQTMQQGKTVPAGSAHQLSVFGVGVEILLGAPDTDGVFSTYRVTVPRGAGVPSHVHQNEEETFYVLNGEFEFLCGEEIVALTAGGQIYLPRQMPHSILNVGTTTGQLLGVGTPAGHEEFFRDAALLGDGPPDFDAAAAVCRRHGMELLPPPAH